MAVSLKTTLGYHSAEVSKQSLLGLAGCNTCPQNANKLLSWNTKQAKHLIRTTYINQYTQCSGTTLNTYADQSLHYSDGTVTTTHNLLIESHQNSPDCGYKPTITLSCSANSLTLTVNASQAVKDQITVEVYGYTSFGNIQNCAVTLYVGSLSAQYNLSMSFNPLNPPTIEYVNNTGLKPLVTNNAIYTW